MTQQSNLPDASTSHFDAAKAIVDALSKLDKNSQRLAMRFAAETLGLQLTSQSPQPPTPAIQASAAGPAPSGGEVTPTVDIKQFAAAKAPKTDQQFAAVVAYYYRFEAPEAERRDTIDKDTLKEAVRLTGGRRQPKDATFTLNNAKNSGYLDSVGAGQFRINSVGENLVAMALPGNAGDNSPRRRSSPKKKPSKKSPSKSSSVKSARKKRKS
jgi:hypothetical protein